MTSWITVYSAPTVSPLPPPPGRGGLIGGGREFTPRVKFPVNNGGFGASFHAGHCFMEAGEDEFRNDIKGNSKSIFKQICGVFSSENRGKESPDETNNQCSLNGIEVSLRSTSRHGRG